MLEPDFNLQGNRLLPAQTSETRADMSRSQSTQGTYLLLMHEFINYDFYFHGRMDHLRQRIVFTVVSEVGTVSSAQIWLKSSLWVASGSRCDANFTSEGRESVLSLPQIALLLYSLTPHCGCCFDQIHQTTNHTQLLGWVVCLYWLNWFFWALISTRFLSVNKNIAST